MNGPRYAHTVRGDTDIPLAIALGVSLTAVCGLVFVPQYDSNEVTQFPDCPTCHPRAARTGRVRGSHKMPDDVRRELPHYVYRCYDSGDRLLYVGCTYNPPSRLRQHRSEGKKWMAAVARTRLTVFPDRRKALDMERLAIETEHPLHNRQFSLVNRRPA